MKKSLIINPSSLILRIGWLYPELMSTYGDRGNITVLQKRCEWRNIEVQVLSLDLGFRISDLKSCDMIFMGGAQDTQQKIVEKDIRDKKQAIRDKIEEGTPALLICGAYQMFGNYYKEADGTKLPGLGIFDLHTENPGKDRLIGNISINIDDLISNIYDSKNDRSYLIDNRSTLVGFENHGGRTYLGKEIKPLGVVQKGYGNNGKDKTEGAVYKNSFGTYLHGPILPKNPEFADLLISLALEKKYGEKIELEKLDDSIEEKARQAIIKKL